MPDPRPHPQSGTVTVPDGQNLGCIRCGKCCRHWHVYVSEAEAARILALDWGDGDQGCPADAFEIVSGRTRIAHCNDGRCVFLDPAENACRIHARFGEKAKPVGCRLYPLSLNRTFVGECSATVRMDCPAAVKNVGRPLSQLQRELRHLATEVAHNPEFDADDCTGFERAGIDLVLSHAAALCRDPSVPPPRKCLALGLMSDRLRTLGAPFVNDTDTFRQVVPSLLSRVLDDASRHRVRGLGSVPRVLFRQWLVAYLRRDEHFSGSFWARAVRRSGAVLAFVFGGGNPHRLGDEHPDVAMREARLWDARTPDRTLPATVEPGTAAAWEPYWRCVANRLDSYQFFGPFHYGAPFPNGLRALAATYPLVLAAARIHAAARAGERDLTREDVEYAVSAVDHGFGRSALMRINLLRAAESFFAESRAASLLAALGWQ